LLPEGRGVKVLVVGADQQMRRWLYEGGYGRVYWREPSPQPARGQSPDPLASPGVPGEGEEGEEFEVGIVCGEAAEDAGRMMASVRGKIRQGGRLIELLPAPEQSAGWMRRMLRGRPVSGRTGFEVVGRSS